MRVRPGLPGETIIRAPVRDQAELRGLLDRLGDLYMRLMSVNRIDEARGDRDFPIEKESQR